MSAPVKLLAVDVGLRGCGAARFEGGVLTWADHVLSPEKAERGPRAWRAMARAVEPWMAGTDEVAIELMRHYSGGKQKANPADLFELQGIAGYIFGLRPHAAPSGYLNSEWKDQLDNAKVQARVLARLSAAETAALVLHGKTRDHNTYCAVGIGLHHLGRFAPIRVFPGST